MSKPRAWEKYSKYSASFLTTYHKEFNNDEIALENRNSDSQITGTEDLTPEYKSMVFMSGVMSLKDYSYKFAYESMEQFFGNISAMTWKEHNAKALVYMHGLNYHGTYIRSFLLKNGYKQTLKCNFYGSAKIGYKEFAMLSCNNKIFHIILYWNGILIKFVDSLKIVPQQLSDLAEDVNLKPFSVDFSHFKHRDDHKYPNDWTTSLKRNCYILAKYMNMYHKHENKSTKLNNETIGCIAYDYIRKIVKEKTPDFKISDYVRWQPWLVGGVSFPSLMHWGKWVVKKGKIHGIDKNWSYGFIMKGLLPFGKPKLKPDPKWKTYCCYYKILVKKAKIKKKYEATAFMWRPFTYDKNGEKLYYLEKDIDIKYNFIQKATNQVYYVIDRELELWKLTHDMEYKVLEKHYFQTEAYLAPVINKLYKFGDKKRKRVVVNMYGKFSQKWNKEQDFFGSKDDIDTDIYEIRGKKKDTYYEAYNIVKKRKSFESAKPIFIGAYITSAMRVLLISKIKQIIDAGCEYLYCDTDALTFIDNPKNPIKFTDIGTGLDDWKYEFQNADAFCCLCPKQYRVVKDKQIVKFATAGINREAMAAVKNQDYNYDLGDNNNYKIIKNHLKNTENGKIIINQSYNFKKWKTLKKNPVCPKELWN